MAILGVLASSIKSSYTKLDTKLGGVLPFGAKRTITLSQVATKAKDTASKAYSFVDKYAFSGNLPSGSPSKTVEGLKTIGSSISKFTSKASKVPNKILTFGEEASHKVADIYGNIGGGLGSAFGNILENTGKGLGKGLGYTFSGITQPFTQGFQSLGQTSGAYIEDVGDTFQKAASSSGNIILYVALGAAAFYFLSKK